MTTKSLLVELFVEELPPKALKKLGDAFASVLAGQLKDQGLSSAESVVTAYASPRRLAAPVGYLVDLLAAVPSVGAVCCRLIASMPGGKAAVRRTAIATRPAAIARRRRGERWPMGGAPICLDDQQNVSSHFCSGAASVEASGAMHM